MKIMIDDGIHDSQEFVISVYGDENVAEQNYEVTTEF